MPPSGPSTRGSDGSSDPTAVADIEGAYFASNALLNQTTATVEVSEFEPTFVSADKARITFTVQYFSGYILASGRN